MKKAVIILWATTLAFAAMFCIRGCVQENGLRVHVTVDGPIEFVER